MLIIKEMYIKTIRRCYLSIYIHICREKCHLIVSYYIYTHIYINLGNMERNVMMHGSFYVSTSQVETRSRDAPCLLACVTSTESLQTATPPIFADSEETRWKWQYLCSCLVAPEKCETYYKSQGLFKAQYSP